LIINKYTRNIVDLLLYYRQSNYTDISGTTVPIFRVAMNEIQKLLRYVRHYA